MANEEHLAILRQGVEVWNRWRENNARTKPDLSGANLRGFVLPNVDFNDADLENSVLVGTGLRRATLTRAKMRNAHLMNANLAHANLCAVNLRGADLTRTNLSDSDLRWANLSGAIIRDTAFSRADLTQALLGGALIKLSDFRDADLTEAVFNLTTFSDLDLRSIRGLTQAKHLGPSTIGIDTIYRSQGEIPEVFLRGAGVPDSFITYAQSLVGKPIEFYSCFISYSTTDQLFAERLHTDLQSKGVRCWFAPHDIKGGRKLHEQIDEAIRIYDRLLLILSPASMSSEWVATEIAKVRKRELREKRQMLFPVRVVDYDAIRNWEAFDADTGKDSAREIREYFIPDFSRWKEHDAYQTAFDRLLRDLKADGSSQPRQSSENET